MKSYWWQHNVAEVTIIETIVVSMHTNAFGTDEVNADLLLTAVPIPFGSFCFGFLLVPRNPNTRLRRWCRESFILCAVTQSVSPVCTANT